MKNTIINSPIIGFEVKPCFEENNSVTWSTEGDRIDFFAVYARLKVNGGTEVQHISDLETLDEANHLAELLTLGNTEKEIQLS